MHNFQSTFSTEKYEIFDRSDSKTMNLEKLIESILKHDSFENESQLFDVLLDSWVYFYFHETNGNDTTPGRDNVEAVIFIGTDNPINLPMVDNGSGRNGVIYTNLELAIRLTSFNCKIGKMRGINAIKMHNEIKGFGGLYIQADYGQIHLNKAKVTEMLRGASSPM